MVSSRYVSTLIDVIPHGIFVLSWVILCVGSLILIRLKGVKLGLYYSFKLILIEYLFLITCSTVLFRKTKKVRKIELTPFWSYDSQYLIDEIIMNVVVFVPIGFLLGFCFIKWPWWKIFAVGCLFSISIETLQLIFRKGYCEFDDVFHNTMGCLIGYGLFLLTTMMVQRFRLN